MYTSKTRIIPTIWLMATAASAANFTIATPASLIECQPVAVTWTGGVEPYILAAIPGGQVSASALETIADSITSTTYTWTVDIASGTSVTLKLTDSTGSIVYSSEDVIQAGSSTSCLSSSSSSNSTASAASTSAGSGSGTVVSSSTVSGSASAAVVSSGSVAGSTTKSSSSTSASAAATTSASSASQVVSAIQFPALLLTAMVGILAFF